MWFKKNIALIIAICIPIMMIGVVAVSIYLPAQFIHPQFNFLYLTRNDLSGSYYRNSYQVQQGKLIKQQPLYPPSSAYAPPSSPIETFFIYDTTTNTAREVTESEAMQLNLDPGPLSPDEFEIVMGSSSNGFFPFYYGGTDYNSRYLKGHNVSKKLQIETTGSSYDNFQFLGWIKK